jgi:uncharacterized protein (DUF1778 family)
MKNYNLDSRIDFRISSEDKVAFKEAAKILGSDISKILSNKVKSVLEEVKDQSLHVKA